MAETGNDPFGGDDLFIFYCAMHSETPRALFAAKHIERLYRLANEPLPELARDFYSMGSDIAHPLCAKARAIAKHAAKP